MDRPSSPDPPHRQFPMSTGSVRNLAKLFETASSSTTSSPKRPNFVLAKRPKQRPALESSGLGLESSGLGLECVQLQEIKSVGARASSIAAAARDGGADAADASSLLARLNDVVDMLLQVGRIEAGGRAAVQTEKLAALQALQRCYALLRAALERLLADDGAGALAEDEKVSIRSAIGRWEALIDKNKGAEDGSRRPAKPPSRVGVFYATSGCFKSPDDNLINRYSKKLQESAERDSNITLTPVSVQHQTDFQENTISSREETQPPSTEILKQNQQIRIIETTAKITLEYKEDTSGSAQIEETKLETLAEPKEPETIHIEETLDEPKEPIEEAHRKFVDEEKKHTEDTHSEELVVNEVPIEYLPEAADPRETPNSVEEIQRTSEFLDRERKNADLQLEDVDPGFRPPTGVIPESNADDAEAIVIEEKPADDQFIVIHENGGGKPEENENVDDEWCVTGENVQRAVVRNNVPKEESYLVLDNRPIGDVPLVNGDKV